MRNGLKIIYWPILFFMSLWHFPRFRGRKNIPEGAAVLCANHTGLADPVWVVLAARQKHMFWIMAKKQVMDKPVIGRLLSWFGAFGVDRDGADVAAIKKSLTVLREGERLLIFPEGTRVKKGMQVAPKPGAVMLANRAGVPLVPIYITPNRKPFQPIRVIIGEPWQPVFAGKKAAAAELETATAELMQKIEQLGR